MPTRRSVTASLLGALLAAAPAARARAQPPARLVPIGSPLPDARLDGLNGPSRRLADFRGRPLLINVWASWCGPCRAETASLERLAWHDSARRFALIGISTDDYAERARAWLGRSNATISHYLDHELLLEMMLGADKLPLTVLVDARGRVLARHYGAREWDTPESIALIARTFGHAATSASVRR